jgi:hypothetical protein
MQKYHDQFLEGLGPGDRSLPTRQAVTRGKVEK